RDGAAIAGLGRQQPRPRPGRADPGGSRARQVPPGGRVAGGGRQGPHLGGDPLLPVSHGERLSSDHRTFEARVRLAAGGYRAAAPGKARSRARRLQDLAPLRERQVVRRPDDRTIAGGPLSASFDDGAAAARCDPRCDRCLADRNGPAQEARLAQVFSRQYHLITRDDRLDKIAEDVVRHFAGRGYRGKAMYIAIDKATALRMHDKVRARWHVEIERLEKALVSLSGEERAAQEAKIAWMKATDMAVIVSAGQN